MPAAPASGAGTSDDPVTLCQRWKAGGCQWLVTIAGMSAPTRHPHGPRSGPIHHENHGGPDLNFNSPYPSTLCILFPRNVSGHRKPYRCAMAVVTWTALRPRPAKQFGSRSSRRAERRKARETATQTHSICKVVLVAGKAHSRVLGKATVSDPDYRVLGLQRGHQIRHIHVLT